MIKVNGLPFDLFVRQKAQVLNASDVKRVEAGLLPLRAQVLAVTQPGCTYTAEGVSRLLPGTGSERVARAVGVLAERGHFERLLTSSGGRRRVQQLYRRTTRGGT